MGFLFQPGRAKGRAAITSYTNVIVPVYAYVISLPLPPTSPEPLVYEQCLSHASLLLRHHHRLFLPLLPLPIVALSAVAYLPYVVDFYLRCARCSFCVAIPSTPVTHMTFRMAPGAVRGHVCRFC